MLPRRARDSKLNEYVRSGYMPNAEWINESGARFDNVTQRCFPCHSSLKKKKKKPSLCMQMLLGLGVCPGLQIPAFYFCPLS